MPWSSFAAAAVLLLINPYLGIAGCVLASLIAFSRLYLYVHYPDRCDRWNGSRYFSRSDYDGNRFLIDNPDCEPTQLFTLGKRPWDTPQGLLLYLILKIGSFKREFKTNPVMMPASLISIFSAAGTFGNPGMTIISPVRATINPAPADTRTSLTERSKSVGQHNSSGLSDKEHWVFRHTNWQAV